jgi:hypothetical protein
MLTPLDARYGLRSCDGAILTSLPEIEVEADLITTAIIYNEYGLSFAQNGNGHDERDQFAWSPAGFVVMGIAKSIAGWFIYRCNVTNMSPNMVHQAFHRHSNMIRVHGARVYALYYACYGINCASFGSAMEPSGGGRLEGTSPYEIELRARNGSLLTIRSVYDLVKMKPSESFVKTMKKARKIANDAGLVIN